MSSPTILDQIGDATRVRVEKRRLLPLPERPVDLPPASVGRFREAICRPSPAVPLRFLCEMKRSSPSKGILRADFEPAELAHEYALHGADALSILTEPEFFGGSHADLTAARLASGRPCLLKDFVLDPFQIEEAAHYGADAILLIVALLSDGDLTDLLDCAEKYHLDALIEVHSEEELGRALSVDADLIGINNRNLETFEVDPEVTARLRPLVSHGVSVVSESGISTAEDVRRFSEMGVDALLIGEHFMKSESPGKALLKLKEAAKAAVQAAP